MGSVLLAKCVAAAGGSLPQLLFSKKERKKKEATVLHLRIMLGVLCGVGGGFVW